MLTDGNQTWHERITLFSALRLKDTVRSTAAVEPDVFRRHAVGEPDVRNQFRELVICAHTLEDTASGNMVKRADATDRQNCGLRVPFGQVTKRARDAFRSSPR